MRHVTPTETPSLFPDLLGGDPAVEPAVEENVEEKAEGTPDALARSFVHWCWGFGNDFRNSPDITNLRVWLRKVNASPTANEEEDILEESRRLFLKKVEQAVRKADVPKDKD
jgi:hypothetical protein